MKSFAIVLGLILAASATPVFADKTQDLRITPTDLENMFIAFVDGLNITAHSNSTVDCTNSLDAIFNTGALAINQWEQGNGYVGTLNFTTALGLFSPATRQCQSTITDVSNEWEAYWSRFEDFSDLTQKLAVNIGLHFQDIRNIGIEMTAELLVSKNYTAVASLTGQLLYKVFSFADNPIYQNPKNSLTYTETNPLAPNPMQDWLWIPLEASYHFLTNSKMVETEPLAECEGSSANFLVEIDAALKYNKAGQIKNAIYAIADAMTYTHDMVEGCTATGQQIGHTADQVWIQVFKGGKFFKFFLNSLVGLIFVDTPFLIAEISYSDTINMFGAIGQIVNRVMVKQLTE